MTTVAVIVCLAGWTMSLDSPAGSAPPTAVAAGSAPTNTATNTWLNAVSCVSATDCFAVGASALTATSPSKTLVERWNGKTWSTVPTPNTGGSQVAGVSCTSATNCMAVGTVAATAKSYWTALTEHWNGTTWSVVASPSPIHRELSAVSCTDATDCMAVGFGGYERWNGKSWSIITGAAIGPTSVSCASTSVCFAVGSQGGAARWNGKTWSAVPTPKPDPNQFEGFGLAGVSCPSPTACFAVGTDAVPLGVFSTLVERWNGKTWSRVPSTGALYFNAVSCTSPTHCFAVGISGSPNGPNPASAGWNGMTWFGVTSPKPTGTFGLFNGVSCTSATNCFAVGYDTNANFSVARTLIEHWDGKTWTIVPSPNVG